MKAQPAVVIAEPIGVAHVVVEPKRGDIGGFTVPGQSRQSFDYQTRNNATPAAPRVTTGPRGAPPGERFLTSWVAECWIVMVDGWMVNW